ncbi:MAG: xanthine dehydrogenase family protein molybdopterin-binding subunit [Antricoccus sp.]
MTITPARPDIRPTPTKPTGPVMGQPLDRRDGVPKTTGTAHFSAEYDLPELAYAALVHASISRGTITAIDTTAAFAHDGVIDVITHLNAPKLKSPPKTLNPLDLSTMAAGSTISFLNTDQVFVDGQPIAVVVADTLEAAAYAASLVKVDYVPLPVSVDFDAAMPAAKPAKGLPVGPPLGGHTGDAKAAFAAAAVTVDLQLSTPQHNHNALEPHATTAVWDNDRLTVYEGSQNIEWTQKYLAKRFKVPATHVRVVSQYVGGAFGGKTQVWAGTLIACIAAKVTGRPVCLALTREGVNRTVGARTATRQRVAIGADSSGRMTALIHTAITRTGKVGGGPEHVTACAHDLYDVPNILAQQRTVELDLMPNTFMRAPGESTGSFGIESAVDELAISLGMDPLEVRLMNQPDDRSPIGHKPYSHRRLATALRRGADLFGWSQRPAGGTQDGNEFVGWGVACAIHPVIRMIANVELQLDNGQATLRSAFHEMGMGSATAVAQMVADGLQIPYADVAIEYGDSALPNGPGAGGSAQTASLAASIERACEQARKRIGDGETSFSVKIGADSGARSVPGQLRMMKHMALDERRLKKAATGAHFCEVRVDADTGEVRVTRWVASFDIGRVINAKTAASQLRGGIVMGLGLALTEQTLIDSRTGRIMNAGLGDYHVPVHADVPRIEIDMLDDPDPAMPMGVVGAGEVSIVGVGAAVANAVRHATGTRVLDLPITLDKVLPRRG